LKPIVVINKVDRPTARVAEVENEIFDLFCNLDANDDQLDYQIIYAAAKDGWAVNQMDKERVGVEDLLVAVRDHVPCPKGDLEAEFKMLITQSEYNQYFGRQLIGRVHSGSIKKGDQVCSVNQEGEVVEVSKISRIVKKYGMSEIEIPIAFAGDIVSLAGF
jgi:GTP-binding protein